MVALPTTQIGVLRDEQSAQLKQFPVPEPGPNEVLIKNVAVAANPKDWKHPYYSKDYSYIEGSDVAGNIVKIGEGVTGLKVGDRVAAFTKMAMKENKYGAYAEYSVAPAATTIPILDNLGFEEASTVPLAIFTAAVGLFRALGINNLPDTPFAEPVPGRQEAVIVYGASSSVGAYVVQLAKLSGYFVVGVAGSSTQYAKSLGADAVVDYREYKDATELGDAIVNALTGHPSSVAYDCIVTGDSSVALAHAVTKASPTDSGKLTHIVPLSEDAKKHISSKVETIHTYIGSAFGKDEAFCAHFSRQLGAYLTLKNGVRALRPNNVKIMPNGLASVGEGLRLLENNQVHAEKLVYRIAETPNVGQA